MVRVEDATPPALPIANAAVDGVVPEGHLRTPAQAYHDVMEWLKRLDTGETRIITRPKIVVPLPDADPADVNRRQRRYGDFSTIFATKSSSRQTPRLQRCAVRLS